MSAAEPPGIILVRHAMPVVERGTASRLWRLDERAREDCVLLAHALPERLAPVVYTSDQPKAAETGTIIGLRRGLRTASDPRFGEAGNDSAWIEDYRSVAGRYVAGEAIDGWEDQEHVVTRFEAAVRDASRDAGQGDLVIATHGMAMSLWLTSRADLDIVPFWRRLTFPDAWRLDLTTGTLKRLFASGVGPGSSWG